MDRRAPASASSSRRDNGNFEFGISEFEFDSAHDDCWYAGVSLAEPASLRNRNSKFEIRIPKFLQIHCHNSDWLLFPEGPGSYGEYIKPVHCKGE